MVFQAMNLEFIKAWHTSDWSNLGKFESEYSSKWNVRKVSDVVKDQLSNTDRAARSVHEFEEYEQDVPDTLPLVENKMMLLFCAVNTDFTDLETEPDASVDSSF